MLWNGKVDIEPTETPATCQTLGFKSPHTEITQNPWKVLHINKQARTPFHIPIK
jgi:hypothetical protein